MPDWYLKHEAGAESYEGPISNEQLIALARKGTVTPNTLVALNEPIKWHRASKVNRLFELARRREVAPITDANTANRTATVNPLETRIAQLESAIAMKEAALTGLTHRIQELEKRSSAIAPLAQQVSSVQTVVHDIAQLRTEAAETSTITKKYLAEIARQIAVQRNSAAAFEAALEQKLSTLQAQWTSTVEQNATRVIAAEERVSESVDAAQNIQSRLVRVEEAIEHRAASCQRVDDELQNFANSLATISSQTEALLAQEDLNGQLQQCLADCLELRSSQDHLRQQQEQAATELRSHASSFLNSNQDLHNSITALSEGLHSHILQAGEELSQNRSGLERLGAQFGALSAQVADLSSQLTSQQRETQQLNQAYGTLTQSLEQLHELSSQCASLRHEATVRSEAIEQLQAKLGTISRDTAAHIIVPVAEVAGPPPSLLQPELDDAPALKCDVGLTCSHSSNPDTSDRQGEIATAMVQLQEVCPREVPLPFPEELENEDIPWVVFTDNDCELPDAISPNRISVASDQVVQGVPLANLDRPEFTSPTSTEEWQDLATLHKRLESHFTALAAQRSPQGISVYFLEHGLSPAELKAVRSLVTEGLQKHDVGASPWWGIRYLPLLVLATEEGYTYNGNGTDYWPVLRKAVGVDFDFDERRRISSWFQGFADRVNGVKPMDSDWDKAFCHIAWPITHAVAAKDIRRPFADCLRRFEGRVEDDDQAIAGQLLSIASKVGARRFRIWLKREAVVASIVRDLLGGPKLHEKGLFSEVFRNRLIADLRSEPEIQQAVRSVQKLRQTGSPSKTIKAVETAPEPDVIRFGEFFLTKDEQGSFELFGELPEMPRTVQNSLRTIRRKWQPRPWGFGGAVPLPSDALRSARGTFPVKLTHVARATRDQLFFTGLEELSLDAQCASWLQSVRFHASDKLVFRPVIGEVDSSHAITSPTPHSGPLWVITATSPAAAWPEIERTFINEADQCRSFDVHEIDAANAALREWLGWPAAHAPQDADALPVQWLLPSPVSTSEYGKRTFAIDDEIGVCVQVERTVELVLLQGQAELERQQVAHAALLRFESPGEYELQVQEGEEILQSLSFAIVNQRGDGLNEPDPVIPWRCVLSHVETGKPTLTRKDLFNRRLILEVESDRAIENLTVVVSLSPGDVSSKVFLPRIPARLHASHPLWDELIGRLPASIVQSTCDLSLQVEIENVSKDAWQLEAACHHLWWEGSADGLPNAVSDQDKFSTRHECLITGKPFEVSIPGDPFLSVASDHDGNDFDFDARVSVVGAGLLQRQLERPARLLRQMDDLPGNVGLRTIATRYLRLSSATSSSLVAEVNRVGAVQTLREWILQSVCGSNWAGQQREAAAIEELDPISKWWQVQHSFPGLVLPSKRPSRRLPETLPDLALAEVGQRLPPAWWDGTVADVSPDDAALLDPVFQKLLNDRDICIDTEALTASLRLANESLCGSHLADLVVPATGGDALLSWSISGQSISALADSLFGWTKEFLKLGRGRQSWKKEELADWMTLLLYPEQLRKRPWRAVLEKLLLDRPVARAGAFLAWRVEQNARLEAMSEPTLSGKTSAI